MQTQASKRIIVFLLVLSGLILCYDLWEVVSGHADLNEHIPFLVPAVLLIFARIVWVIENDYDALSPETRASVVEQANEESFLAPQHHPSPDSR